MQKSKGFKGVNDNFTKFSVHFVVSGSWCPIFTTKQQGQL